MQRPVSPLTVSVVMPVYNEAGSVAEVAERVLEESVVTELIIVDDASDDGTWQKLQELQASEARIRIFRHGTNQGKGAALRTGFEQAVQEVVLIQDADFEYSPSDYEILLQPIFSGRADAVFGSRFAGAGAHRVLYFWHYVGNKLLTLLSNMATNLNLTDMETGYKAFRREVLRQITLEEDRFGFEPEITAKVARLGVRIYEVPVSYFGRTYAEGKKISWKDGISALRCIVKYGLFG